MSYTFDLIYHTINNRCYFKFALGDTNQPEALNRKALTITNRVRDKLTGRDFAHEETLSVQKQVDLLIQQATNNENLSQCYIGWYVLMLLVHASTKDHSFLLPAGVHSGESGNFSRNKKIFQVCHHVYMYINYLILHPDT